MKHNDISFCRAPIFSRATRDNSGPLRIFFWVLDVIFETSFNLLLQITLHCQTCKSWQQHSVAVLSNLAKRCNNA